MTLLYIPARLLRAEETPPPKLAGAAKSAGRTAANVVVNSRSDGGGLWTFSRSGIPIRTADDLRFWNAMQEALDGGATPVIVPVCEARTAPWPIVNGARVTSYGDIPFSDGALFSDGSGFSQSVIDFDLAEDVTLRDTVMTLTRNMASALRGGELFSLDYGAALGPRWHRIIDVATEDDTIYTVTVRPPARDDLAAGAKPNFDAPECVMQLDAMEIPLQLGKFAKVSISFIESFLPLD